jgi:hypothetical protein
LALFYWPPCTCCKTSSALLKFSVPEFPYLLDQLLRGVVALRVRGNLLLARGEFTPCR